MSVKTWLRDLVSEQPWVRRCYFWYGRLTTLTEWHAWRELPSLVNGRGRAPFAVLDAGCGFGQYAYRIARRWPQAQVTAVEFDAQRAETFTRFVERARLPIRCRQADLQTLDDRACYDLIVCLDVLEHIPNDAAAVHQLARALKPGGWLLVGTPVNPQRRILPGSARLMDLEHGHAHPWMDHCREGYTRDELAALLTREGLVVRRERWTYGWCGALAYEIWFRAQRVPGRFLLWAPLYFLLVHPFVWLCMLVDRWVPRRHGNGLLLMAQKP